MWILKFCKEGKKWYIDLPEWTGRKSALQMVAGADKLLDLMANGENVVNIYVDEENFVNAEHLILIKKCWWNGADYKIETYEGKDINLKVWLCDVTKHVLGRFPKDVYFAKFN